MDSLKTVLSTFLEIIRTLKEFIANLETELGVDFEEILKKNEK